jgi:hypothetical protein
VHEQTPYNRSQFATSAAARMMRQGLALSEPASAPAPAGLGAGPGKAVQVDSIKPILKAPGTEHLILKSDKLLSSVL